MEGLLLLFLVVSPWFFGCIHPFFHFCLTLGLSAVFVLWALYLVVVGRIVATRFQMPILGLLALGLIQLLPLGNAVNILSPATARLKSDLYSSGREVLIDGEPSQPAPWSADGRISFYPAETWNKLLWLIQLGLLFTCVQTTLASRESLHRLSLACLANGSLLAFFAMAQFFSSPAGTLYWTFPSHGAAFGPFVNRNHFACLMNICVGLTIGLLYSQQRRRRSRSLPQDLLRQMRSTKTLAIAASLVLMIASMLMSSSRGGVISFLGALAIVTVVHISHARTWRNWLTTVTMGCVAAVLMLAWLGFDLVQSRYVSLWTGEAIGDGRLEIWQQVLPLVVGFGALGSGLGTFPYVEPLSRVRGDTIDLFWDYAHNEYLQLAIEAGPLGLICALALAFMLFRACQRAVGQPHSAGRLYIGPLFALSTVVIHSFVEFGIEMPAIAVLAAVVFAQIAGVDRRMGAVTHDPLAERQVTPPADRTEGGTRGLRRITRASLASIAFAACFLLVSILALAGARRDDLAERSRLAALRAHADQDKTAELAHFIAASSIAPSRAELRLTTARLRFDEAAEGDIMQPEVTRMLAAAQRDAVAARDLCPLLAEAHVLLGSQAETFRRADAKADYYRRSLRIRRTDATLAYLLGLERLSAGDREGAMHQWRESLKLSERHLDDVLLQADETFGMATVVEQILPPSPHLLLRLAKKDFTDTADAETRSLLVRRIEYLLDRVDLPEEDNCYLRASTLALSGQPDAALDEYQAAISLLQSRHLADLRPREIDWRYEYGKLLLQQGRLDNARQQIRWCARQRPKSSEYRALLEQVHQAQLRGGHHAEHAEGEY